MPEQNSPLVVMHNFNGHQVRFVGTREKPEWVAQDVAAAIGVPGNPGNILRAFTESEKGLYGIQTHGGYQKLLTVTEPGLYRLIFKSRKPEAEAFRHWVTHEVLPAIRLHGCYPPPAVKEVVAPAKPLTHAEILLQSAQMLVDHEREIEAVRQRVQAIEERQKQATLQLTHMELPEKKAPEKSVRGKINELLRLHVQRSNLDYGKTWGAVYTQLYYRCGVDVKARHKKRPSMSLLDIVEEADLLTDLYAIVYEMFSGGSGK